MSIICHYVVLNLNIRFEYADNILNGCILFKSSVFSAYWIFKDVLIEILYHLSSLDSLSIY